MRTYLPVFMLCFALPCTLPAQGGTSPTSGQSEDRGVNETTEPSTEMVALEHFLRLSDDQLTAMAAAIDRVRNMSQDERRRLETQIAAYRKLPTLQREQIRLGWVSEKDWEDWREMIQSLSQGERASIQTTLQAMPFEERAAHKHTLLEAWRAKQEKEE